MAAKKQREKSASATDSLPPVPEAEILARLWRARDWAGFLDRPLSCLGAVFLDGRPVYEAILELVAEAPPELKESRPIAVLRLAYALYGAGVRNEADFLMAEIRQSLERIPNADKRRKLVGEWTLISLFAHCPDLYAMLPVLRRAAGMIGGRSEALTSAEPFMFGALGCFALFHLKAGKAEEEGRLLAEFAALYSALTGGGADGADALYHAELCFYRGDLEQAELLSYKSAYLAEHGGLGSLVMGVTYLLAQIGIARGDAALFDSARAKLEAAARYRAGNAPLKGRLLDYTRGLLLAEMARPSEMAAWIRNGETGGMPHFLRLAVHYLQMRCSFYEGEFLKTIGMAEGWCDGPGWGLLVPAVTRLYSVSACVKLGRRGQAEELLERAAALCFPDGLLLFFGSFGPLLSGLEQKPLRRELPEAVELVRRLQAGYSKGWAKIASHLAAADGLAVLSEREREVARLATEGLSNREIAESLGITERTVKFHLTAVFHKLGVKRRSQLPGVMP